MWRGWSFRLRTASSCAIPLVGGVILFARNYVDNAQLAALCADIHAARAPPLIIAVDQEGGRVQRFKSGFSVLPPARRLGHEFDIDANAALELARRLGWLMAAELRAHGVDHSFMPCVDLDYGTSEVIGERALDSRSAVVAQLGVAYAHGMRDAGMAATAKHFPGHGAVVADSHRVLPVDRRELADLQEDIAPYRLLIANGLAAVMVAHVVYPALDSQPASVSRRWMQGMLRGELRFQGAIFSDDLSMGAAASVGDLLTRARLALDAGCDMLPVCNDRAGVLGLVERLKPEPVTRFAAAPRAHAWPRRPGAQRAAGGRGLAAGARGAGALQLPTGFAAALGSGMNNWSIDMWRKMVDAAPEGIVICDAKAKDLPVDLRQSCLHATLRVPRRRLARFKSAHSAGHGSRAGRAAASARGHAERSRLPHHAAQLSPRRLDVLERGVHSATQE